MTSLDEEQKSSWNCDVGGERCVWTSSVVGQLIETVASGVPYSCLIVPCVTPEFPRLPHLVLKLLCCPSLFFESSSCGRLIAVLCPPYVPMMSSSVCCAQSSNGSTQVIISVFARLAIVVVIVITPAAAEGDLQNSPT